MTTTITLAELALLRYPDHWPAATREVRKTFKGNVRRILVSRGIQHAPGGDWPREAALAALKGARPTSATAQRRSASRVDRALLDVASAAEEYAGALTYVPPAGEAQADENRATARLRSLISGARPRVADDPGVAGSVAMAHAELIRARAVLSRAVEVDLGGQLAADLRAHDAAAVRLHLVTIQYEKVSVSPAGSRKAVGVLDAAEGDL